MGITGSSRDKCAAGHGKARLLMPHRLEFNRPLTLSLPRSLSIETAEEEDENEEEILVGTSRRDVPARVQRAERMRSTREERYGTRNAR